jgi:hypothetical protein
MLNIEPVDETPDLEPLKNTLFPGLSGISSRSDSRRPRRAFAAFQVSNADQPVLC